MRTMFGLNINVEINVINNSCLATIDTISLGKQSTIWKPLLSLLHRNGYECTCSQHTKMLLHMRMHAHAHTHTCIHVILVKEASLMTTHINIIVIYVMCFMESNVHFKQGASTVVNINSD